MFILNSLKVLYVYHNYFHFVERICWIRYLFWNPQIVTLDVGFNYESNITNSKAFFQFKQHVNIFQEETLHPTILNMLKSISYIYMGYIYIGDLSLWNKNNLPKFFFNGYCFLILIIIILSHITYKQLFLLPSLFLVPPSHFPQSIPLPFLLRTGYGYHPNMPCQL